MRIIPPESITPSNQPPLSISEAISEICSYGSDLYISLNTFRDEEPDFSILNAAEELEMEIRSAMAYKSSLNGEKRIIHIAQNITTIVESETDLRRFFCHEEMRLNAMAFLLLLFSYQSISEVETLIEESD